MRVAEQELDEQSDILPVYVSFNISSLIDTEDPLQFYHWMLAKTLKALLNKLRKRGLSVSAESVSLMSNHELENFNAVEIELKQIVKGFENSYKNASAIEIDVLPEIEDVKEAIESICYENMLGRIYFFFDEAAHVFRPDQQRQFFSLYKDLRSPFITCNAAIYPGVTHFGDSFEPIHDCIYKRIERDVRDETYISYFEDMVQKQSEDDFFSKLQTHRSLFQTLAICAGGNPRMVLKTIQDLAKFNTASVDQLVKDFYRNRIWAEHTELGEKFEGHKELIDWGRDFLENTAIPAIEKYNIARKRKGINESTIYFWVHKDAPAAVKEALRLMSYTGIIRRTDSGVRATRAELGSRYEVKYGCILARLGKPHSESQEFYNSLSLKKFPEFGKNHGAYEDVVKVTETVADDERFRKSLKNMLSKPIDVLQMLTNWQIGKLKSAGVLTVEDLYNKTEEELIRRIYNVGPVRARIMKNAANAELLEYLSG
ncbi:MAG: hypothetical protein CMO55_08855 [Verrucomicrobiales bacterium]|nr:hypothetical protein [Verrucomicrobiales bacterium]